MLLLLSPLLVLLLALSPVRTCTSSIQHIASSRFRDLHISLLSDDFRLLRAERSLLTTLVHNGHPTSTWTSCCIIHNRNTTLSITNTSSSSLSSFSPCYTHSHGGPLFFYFATTAPALNPADIPAVTHVTNASATVADYRFRAQHARGSFAVRVKCTRGSSLAVVTIRLVDVYMTIWTKCRVAQLMGHTMKLSTDHGEAILSSKSPVDIGAARLLSTTNGLFAWVQDAGANWFVSPHSALRVRVAWECRGFESFGIVRLRMQGWMGWWNVSCMTHAAVVGNRMWTGGLEGESTMTKWPKGGMLATVFVATIDKTNRFRQRQVNGWGKCWAMPTWMTRDGEIVRNGQMRWRAMCVCQGVGDGGVRVTARLQGGGVVDVSFVTWCGVKEVVMVYGVAALVVVAGVVVGRRVARSGGGGHIGGRVKARVWRRLRWVRRRYEYRAVA